MQKSSLTINTKSKILLVLTIAVFLVSLPVAYDKLDSSESVYYVIHVSNVIIGLFLAIVGILTYFEFRSGRLLMISMAFFTITIAELSSLINFVIPLFESPYGFHSLLTHGLVLMMLSFFAIGIFRSD